VTLTGDIDRALSAGNVLENLNRQPGCQNCFDGLTCCGQRASIIGYESKRRESSSDGQVQSPITQNDRSIDQLVSGR
jgi:hypothetical protein